MREVYLDNGSTSFPKAPGVGEAMREFIGQVGVNIGRGGYARAYDTGAAVYGVREALCRLFGFRKPSNVIFTSGATEGLNFVIRGLLRPGDEAVISAVEHNAVARPCEALRRQGVSISICGCDRAGRLDLDDLAARITERTRLVVITHASNVSGTVLDISGAGRICREKGVFFAVDAAQSAGVIPVDMNDCGISALCLTGHKGLLGPQGTGAVLLTDEIASAMEPLLCGGTGSRSDSLMMPDFLPDRFEAGTLNIPGILGLGAALRYIEETGIDAIRGAEMKRTGELLAGLANFPEVRVVGMSGTEERLASVSVDFDGMDNADVARLLVSEYGIMTRCGLHCAPLAHRTFGTFPRGTVRFSIGHRTTEDDILYTIEAIGNIIRESGGTK